MTFIKKIISIKSIYYSVISFFIFLLTYSLDIKFKFIYIIIAIILLCTFVYRVIKRGLELKYIDASKFDLGNDSDERACQIIEVFITSLLGVFIVFKIGNFNINFLLNNQILNYILFPIVVFIISSYFALSRCSHILKAISILMTTIQGLLIVPIGAIAIIGSITMFLSSLTKELTMPQLQPFEATDLLMIVASYELMIGRMVLFGIASILCQVLFFAFIPPYQTNSLQIAYKILNVFIVASATVILMVSGFAYDYAMEGKDELIKTIEIDYQVNEISEGEYKAVMKGINTVSKSSFANIIAILFMPYTIGVLLISILISLRENKYEKKTQDLIFRLISAIKKDYSKEYQEELIRKILYYSNKKHIVILKMIEVHTSSNSVFPT